jgi:hypothetical protein
MRLSSGSVFERQSYEPSNRKMPICLAPQFARQGRCHWVIAARSMPRLSASFLASGELLIAPSDFEGGLGTTGRSSSTPIPEVDVAVSYERKSSIVSCGRRMMARGLFNRDDVTGLGNDFVEHAVREGFDIL